jgi:purine catabolism regulator
MAVTVKQVMDIEAFSESVTLIAGHGGITNIITYITVSETPDFYEWVSGGEFVLTTLYAYKDRQDLQVVNYTELAKRGIAAFGVKVQRFVEAIPQDLIDIANKYQVPLFAIRREIKFREIIQIITAELNNYQTNILLEVESHYKELAKVALVSGDFNEYIRGFGRRTGSSVYCFQADLKLLGSYQKSSLGNSAQEVREKLEQYILWQEEVLNPVDYEGLYIFPCVTRGQALGYLVVVNAERLSEKHMLMASQLTTFLTMKLIDQLETVQKMLTSLLDELLYKRDLSEEELRERLSLHGLKQQAMYRVIIVREKDETDSPLPTSQIRTYCNKIKELLDEALVIIKTNETVIIGANEQPDDGNPPRWLKHLGNDVFSDDFPAVIGIGPSVTNAKDIQSSYQIAKSTIKAGHGFGHVGVLYYAHFLARILLLRSVGTPEQEYLLTNIINPLLDQDNRYNSQILPTIKAIMFADDLEQAAATLFVHTNTIRYRLNKIKSITGHDFFSAKGRYTITTAYLVYCYNK